MGSDDERLEFLTECGGVNDASVIRSLLESNGVRVLVQGENHAGLLGANQVLIQPRVLVPASQLAKAREILSAFIVLEGGKGEPEALGDGVCAVHEKPAVLICPRCGNYLCTECKTLGDPPVCEDCVWNEKPRAKSLRQRRAQWWYSAFIVFVLVGLTLVRLVMTLLPG